MVLATALVTAACSVAPAPAPPVASRPSGPDTAGFLAWVHSHADVGGADDEQLVILGTEVCRVMHMPAGQDSVSSYLVRVRLSPFLKSTVQDAADLFLCRHRVGS